MSVDAPEGDRSKELPTVILGDHGEQKRPRVRLLPGKVAEHLVLRPAYAVAAAAGAVATYFAVDTGEWHPAMVIGGWALLICWYWVYGIGYRYRRWLMKYFSVLMSTITAATLAVVTSVRAAAMAVPQGGELVPRGPQPLLYASAALTLISFGAVFAHVVYLGRGYRQKSVDDDNDHRQNASPTD